jgi:hypothetical protein
VDSAPNKANLAIADWGLPIGDSRTSDLGRPCGQNAKQSQSTTFGYIVGQGREIRDTRYEIRAGRADGAPNKANFRDSGLRMRVPRENKANPGGRDGRRIDEGLSMIDYCENLCEPA